MRKRRQHFLEIFVNLLNQVFQRAFEFHSKTENNADWSVTVGDGELAHISI